MDYDGRPEYEMVDEHIDRNQFEEDQFEFEESSGQQNPMPGSMSAIGPERFKHQGSQKVEDFKHETLPKVRSYSRGNSGAMPPQMPLTMAQAASKLDQRRLEKKMGLTP